MNDLEKTLALNEKQRAFYNSEHPNKAGIASRIWSGFRNGLLSKFRDSYNVKTRVYDEHKIWLGDLTNKKVLDLGCLRGNALSFYMAEHAAQYIGIDLSEEAIQILQGRLEEKKYPNASTIAIDFLSPTFEEHNFDVIYAYGVLHHFENFDLLIKKLNEKLSEKGVIISYDPLETSPPIKFVRMLYRPFQLDKAWEWPFTKKVLAKLDQHFTIKEQRGILGSSKYGILINLLPLTKSYKNRVIKKLVEKDWKAATLKDVYPCMHTTMLLQKK